VSSTSTGTSKESTVSDANLHDENTHAKIAEGTFEAPLKSAENNGGSVLTDSRNRDLEQLKAEFGSISDIKFSALYERGKISSAEYDNVLQYVEKCREKSRAERRKKEETKPADETDEATEEPDEEGGGASLRPAEAPAEPDQEEPAPENKKAVIEAAEVVRKMFTKEAVDATQSYLRWAETHPRTARSPFKDTGMTCDSVHFSPESFKMLLQGYENSNKEDRWNTGVKEVCPDRYIIQGSKCFVVTYGWSTAGTRSHYLYHLTKDGCIDRWSIVSHGTALVPNFMSALREFVLNVIEKGAIPEGCEVVQPEAAPKTRAGQTKLF
jgi:hypothetical protein